MEEQVNIPALCLSLFVADASARTERFLVIGVLPSPFVPSKYGTKGLGEERKGETPSQFGSNGCPEKATSVKLR